MFSYLCLVKPSADSNIGLCREDIVIGGMGIYTYISPIMQNQMEKSMENAMKPGF